MCRLPGPSDEYNAVNGPTKYNIERRRVASSRAVGSHRPPLTGMMNLSPRGSSATSHSIHYDRKRSNQRND